MKKMKGSEFMTVSELLLQLNFKPYTKGWYYLCDCIALLSSDPQCKLQAVYYSVGSRYLVSPSDIERICRYTVLTTVLRNPAATFERILGQPFDSGNGYTLSRFFGLCVAALQRK